MSFEEKAKTFLKDKLRTKAKKLAKAIGISSQHAGQLLRFLPEWELADPTQTNRANRIWRRIQ